MEREHSTYEAQNRLNDLIDSGVLAKATVDALETAIKALNFVDACQSTENKLTEFNKDVPQGAK